jgi:hypothetical protein
LSVWENWGDPFSAHYKIRDREWWNKFWDNCPYTQKEIYMALRNIHYCVNHEYKLYERRYISPDPCKFIQGGMIDRSLSGDIADFYEMYHQHDDDLNLGKMRDG